MAYVRACSWTDLGPKTLLADLEFLLLIMAPHEQKGLIFVGAVYSHGQQGQDDFGSWDLSQPLLTMRMFE